MSDSSFLPCWINTRGEYSTLYRKPMTEEEATTEGQRIAEYYGQAFALVKIVTIFPAPEKPQPKPRLSLSDLGL